MWRAGAVRAWGELFLAVWGRDLAQPQSSEAQPPLHAPEALPGREGISVPVWGLSTQLALQGSLLPKETFEIFP